MLKYLFQWLNSDGSHLFYSVTDMTTSTNTMFRMVDSSDGFQPNDYIIYLAM